MPAVEKEAWWDPDDPVFVGELGGPAPERWMIVIHGAIWSHGQERLTEDALAVWTLYHNYLPRDNQYNDVSFPRIVQLSGKRTLETNPRPSIPTVGLAQRGWRRESTGQWNPRCR